jgi:type I restriction enzyme, S subunit
VNEALESKSEDRFVRRFKRYPEYKDSGVEWLGEIPAHWNALQLKHKFAVQLGKMLQSEPSSEADTLKKYLRAANLQWEGVDLSDIKEMWVSPADKEKFRLASGDLLISEGGDIGRATLWNGEIEEMYIQNAINRVRSRDGDSTRFLYYWIYVLKQLGYIDILCNKATIAHYTAEKVGWTEIILPPLLEQLAIMDFLDRETTKIDALVSKKERLIELLQEKRTALITQAVTKGLDPGVPMKNSGVEWLGQIPETWDVRKNKVLFREIDDRSVFGEEELLTVSHITGVTPRSEKEVYMFEAESHEGYKVCSAGDLVINTMWAWMGALGIAHQEGMVSPSYNVYRITDGGLLPGYLDYLCRIPAYVTELTRYSKGVWKSRLRLYPDEFLQVMAVVPPVEEQHAILDYLGQETSRIEALIAKVKLAIERLSEHRTALISAAVTGKIDVREGVV